MISKISSHPSHIQHPTPQQDSIAFYGSPHYNSAYICLVGTKQEHRGDSNFVDCKNVLISVKKKSVFQRRGKLAKIMWCLPKLFPLLPVFPVEGPKGAIAWISAAEKRRQHCTITTTILIFGNILIWRFFLQSLFSRTIILLYCFQQLFGQNVFIRSSF